MDGWMEDDEWVDERMDGWRIMGGWRMMDGWMDGWNDG